MKLPEFCIQRPVFTIVLSLILVVVGIIGFLRIPIRIYPDITPPVISITTTYDGAGPQVIESQVTTPIENDLVGAPGLESIQSSSEEGYSRVTLKYNLGVNMDNAMNDVRDRLARIDRQLPSDADQPIIEKRDPNSLQTMVLGLSDPSMSSMALTDYAKRYLSPQIGQLLGVASVEIYNERDYAMKIKLDPNKMAANHVAVNDLVNVLRQQNVNVPSGQIKEPSRYYNVMTAGELRSAKAFRDLIIRDQNGYLLRFGDVANIHVGPEWTESAMRVDGKPTVGLGIYAVGSANPIKVAAEIQSKLQSIRANLPAGMKIRIIWNNTTYLKATLHTVYRDLLIALGLVTLVVLLFLGSFRSSLIPIVTIPICMIGVIAFIYFLGYSINLFTLLALVLAVGLVVDDAIVMLENIYRHIEAGMSPFKAAVAGSREIAFAIIAMTLTLAAVYAPIGFASGMVGIVFREFAFTLALAVILSGFVALTLSPMMGARLLRLPDHQKGIGSTYGRYLDVFFHYLTRSYRWLLSIILNNRLLVIIVLMAVAVFGFFCLKSLPAELSPKEDIGAFIVSVTPPPNASYKYTDQYIQKVGKYLRTLKPVKTVLMVTESASDGFGFVILKPWSKRHETVTQIIHQVMVEGAKMPGARLSAFNLGQMGGGGRYGDAVQLAISTNQSYLQLHKTVEDFISKISHYSGITNPQQDLTMNDVEYDINIKRNLAAALNVNVSDISQTLQTMIAGATITSFDWNNRDYDVLLRIPDAKMQSLKVFNTLYVRSQSGQMIPLSRLVSIKKIVAPQKLPHLDRMRADTITMQVTPGHSMGQVVQYLRQMAKNDLPSGYQFDFQGVAQQMVKSNHTILGVFGLALVFIYLVLSAQFESFIDPLIILLAVPLSIVGAIFTLKMAHQSVSIYAYIGFVTLIGLITKHGILITEFANQKLKAGEPLREALIDAASLRLRPILMTTAAMTIGVIPLALATGAGALSRQQIGWVIFGGLLFGTLFSLFVVPVAYSIIKSFTQRKRKIKLQAPKEE